jgi:hypothetical protein
VTLVGFWRNVFGGGLTDAVTAADRAPRFATDVDSGVLYGTPTLNDWIYKTGRITRAEALRVPAVKRARDLIAGAVGQFPLNVHDPDGKIAADRFSPTIVTTPEAGIPAAITCTRLVEDLLFEGRSWLKVTSVAWHGRPAEGRLLDASSVTVQPELIRFPEGVATVWPDRPGLIRIDSPNPGLLDASGAIRACVAINRAALNAVNGVPPMDYFTDEDDADPLDEDEVAELLDAWEAARKNRSTAYVPRALKYNVAGWDPAKLQMAEARQEAVLEVARLTGIDAEELSVSTTSRTYFNSQDRRRQRIEDVLGPYLTAIEARLSMDDVTPHGYTARFDTSSYLRLDDLSAAQADAVLIASKVLHPDEARARRNLDPRDLGEPVPADVTAAAALIRPETGARA